jgi:hypothetical protein
MTPSYLEEDVDDAAVAEEADNEEDDVGDGGNMPYHWMLEGHTNIYRSKLKVYSSHLNWGARLYSFDLLLNTRCWQVFNKFFNDTFSREEPKTNLRGLTISKMT